MILQPASRFLSAFAVRDDIQTTVKAWADNNRLYVLNGGVYKKAASANVTANAEPGLPYSCVIKYNNSSVTFAVTEDTADIADIFKYNTADGFNNGTPGDGTIPYNSSQYSIAYDDTQPHTADDGATVYNLYTSNSTKYRDLPVYQVADYIARFHDPAAMNTMAYKSLSNQSEAVCLTYTYSGSTITVPANSWQGGGAYTAGYFSHNCRWYSSISARELNEFSTGSICGTANAKVSEYYRANSTLNYDNDPVGFFPDTALSDNLAISQGAGATFNDIRYITNNVTIQNTFPSGYWVCVPQLAYYVPPNELTFSGTAASSQTVTITSYYTNTQHTGTARGLNFLYSYSNSAEVASYSGSLSTIKYSFEPNRLDCTESLSYTIGQFSTARTTTYTKSINAGAVDSYYLVEAGFTGSSASTYQSTAPAITIGSATETYLQATTSTFFFPDITYWESVANSLNSESYLNCTNWTYRDTWAVNTSLTFYSDSRTEWIMWNGIGTITATNFSYQGSQATAEYLLDSAGLEWSNNDGLRYKDMTIFTGDNIATVYNGTYYYTSTTNAPEISWRFDIIASTTSVTEATINYTFNDTVNEPNISGTGSYTESVWCQVGGTMDTVTNLSMTYDGSYDSYYTYNTNSLLTYPEATVLRTVTRV